MILHWFSCGHRVVILRYVRLIGIADSSIIIYSSIECCKFASSYVPAKLVNGSVMTFNLGTHYRMNIIAANAQLCCSNRKCRAEALTYII